MNITENGIYTNYCVAQYSKKKMKIYQVILIQESYLNVELLLKLFLQKMKTTFIPIKMIQKDRIIYMVISMTIYFRN